MQAGREVDGFGWGKREETEGGLGRKGGPTAALIHFKATEEAEAASNGKKMIPPPRPIVSLTVSGMSQ